MNDLVTFGEAMIRLSPPAQRRLEETTALEATVGGAELNVAAGAARLGLQTAWVSRLPDNPLGRMARNRAREFGVDVSHVDLAAGSRMGLYFVEYGASPRPSTVLYDRARSAFSELEAGSLDWPAILAGARAFHTTGITTALSPASAGEVERALRAAREAGALTSYDLNFRGKLWTPEQARRAQEPLMELVDVLVTTEEDAATVFGVTGEDYPTLARALVERFGFRVATITIRGDVSVLRNSWTAIAYADGTLVDDRTYEVELVDRVGGGDAYASGFLYGMLTGDVAKGVRYGDAASALQQTMWGDLSYVTLGEVETLLAGGGTRIQR